MGIFSSIKDAIFGHPAVQASARATGADVSVCLEPTARMMSGIGERIGPPLGLPKLFCVLVNPAVAVATADVFVRLGIAPGRSRDDQGPSGGIDLGDGAEDIIARLASGRNDLEAPALSIAPAIGDALGALGKTEGCRLARMSGSGATVFGLYDDRRSASRAARVIAADRTAWWVKATVLR